MAKVRHTGIVVSDLKKASHFYQTLFGLSLFSQQLETGSFISNLVTIKDVKIEWMKLLDSEGQMVELLQYHSHPNNFLAKGDSPNRIGCNHLAFTVDNLDEFLKQYKTFGLDPFTQPLVPDNNKVKVFYCTDLDGTLLEVVEEL